MFPEIRLVSGVSLQTYLVYLSLLYSALVVALPRYADWRSMSRTVALNGAMVIMVSGLIGGRLFHVFFESYSFYRGHIERVFEFWYGGFVFYGGFYFAAFCGWIYLKWAKEPVLAWFDFFAPVLSVGYGLGRISCLLAGCCYGQLCDLPWAIDHRHPTQIYASVLELLFLPVLLHLQKKQETTVHKPEGMVFGAWAVWHSMNRIFMESLRADDRGPLPAGLSISTWMSFGLMALGVGLIIFSLQRKQAEEKI
jgi:phosphatidylglycerol:prolipoprotein diacylglycerol transferase